MGEIKRQRSTDAPEVSPEAMLGQGMAAEGFRRVAPQEGPQTQFAMCGADIAFYGGSAGGGKSFGLLLEPLRYCTNPKYAGYSAVIFRRSIPSIRNPGSMWDQSFGVYAEIGGQPKSSALEWEWPGAGKVKFAHLEYESTVFDWHASQISLLAFDEVTEFSEKQFFYMLSRNRSQSGVRPYIRATCNPDADSWVAKFIAWWIDDREYLDNEGLVPNVNYGFARKDRSGKVRFFIRSGNDLVWADHPEDLTHEKLGLPRFAPDGTEILLRPMSMTFIAGSIFDNKALLKDDPDYLGKLLALPTVERERLLRGNWRIRPAPGLYFNRGWVTVVDELPEGLIFKRGWDLAATEKTQGNNPDATASCKIGKDIMNKVYYVVDSTNLQGSPHQVEMHLHAKALGEGGDGPMVEQWFPQDPGQAGKHQIRYFGVQLDGVPVRSTPEVGDKITRFSPFSATAEAGRVMVLRGPWNNRWFSALEAFPPEGAGKDDDVDATSRAFNSFLDVTSGSGLVEYMQIEAEKMRREALSAKGDERPSLEKGGVRVYPPGGVNQLYDMKGRMLQLEADGSFIVAAEHGAVLTGRSGFRYAKGNGAHS